MATVLDEGPCHPEATEQTAIPGGLLSFFPRGLFRHSGRGSNCVSFMYLDWIVELGETPSAGFTGDSFDNATVEFQSPVFKPQLIQKRRPWKTAEQVDWVTSERVLPVNHWHLHYQLDYRSPVEIEAESYA